MHELVGNIYCTFEIAVNPFFKAFEHLLLIGNFRIRSHVANELKKHRFQSFFETSYKLADINLCHDNIVPVKTSSENALACLTQNRKPRARARGFRIFALLIEPW